MSFPKNPHRFEYVQQNMHTGKLAPWPVGVRIMARGVATRLNNAMRLAASEFRWVEKADLTPAELATLTLADIKREDELADARDVLAEQAERD